MLGLTDRALVFKWGEESKSLPDSSGGALSVGKRKGSVSKFIMCESFLPPTLSVREKWEAPIAKIGRFRRHFPNVYGGLKALIH